MSNCTVNMHFVTCQMKIDFPALLLTFCCNHDETHGSILDSTQLNLGSDLTFLVKLFNGRHKKSAIDVALHCSSPNFNYILTKLNLTTLS